MRKYLMIVPEATAPAGLVGETLVGEGALYDALMPIERYASHAPFDYPGISEEAGDYAGLLVLGGPMSANDTDKHPFLSQTMDLIRAFAAEDRPVLGICLGAQIIARTFGGEVYRMERLESCFRTMQMTPKAGPIRSSRPRSDVTSFQNHFEAVRNSVRRRWRPAAPARSRPSASGAPPMRPSSTPRSPSTSCATGSASSAPPSPRMSHAC